MIMHQLHRNTCRPAAAVALRNNAFIAERGRPSVRIGLRAFLIHSDFALLLYLAASFPYLFSTNISALPLESIYAPVPRSSGVPDVLYYDECGLPTQSTL